MECTVIIPTYNRETLLRHTLESLTRQTLPREAFEVIVVDDGSSDGTAAMVEEFRDRLDLHYFFQEDRGWRVAHARNVGIAHARGEVSVFIDSGLLLHAGCLAAHVARHRAHPGPAAVIGYVHGFNLDNEDAEAMLAEVDLSDPTAAIDRLARDGRWPDIRDTRFYAKYGDDFADLPAPWGVFWTCNVSAGTAKIRGVGAFDEAFRTWGGEDLDLGYRLHRDGARFLLARGASAFHVPHPKSREANGEAADANYRYMARKYGTPIMSLMPLFPKVHPFNMNDEIVARGLPSCADFLAARASVTG